MATLLNNQGVITIRNLDVINFDGEDGEWASVIVLDTVYRIENDDGDFVWNSLGIANTNTTETTFEVGVDEGATEVFGSTEQTYSVQWDGYIASQHVFTVTILVDDEKENRDPKRLPADLSEELVESTSVEDAAPSGVWADFNGWHRRYRIYKQFALRKQELLYPEDLPDEPRVEDY